MSNVSFADLGLAEPLLRALHAANYVQPTPIQARTIPLLLQGRDVLGIFINFNVNHSIIICFSSHFSWILP